MTAQREKFISIIAPIAQDAMRTYHMLASVTIAQACLESADGTSGLAKPPNNNLFGVKGVGVKLPTTEVVNGKTVSTVANFRIYDSWRDSVMDRTQMLLNAKVDADTYRYRHLQNLMDPSVVAKGLQKAGYATDPNYADKIIAIVNQYNLTKYDKIDEKPSAWAADAWAWATSPDVNLIDGTNPQGNVTREQLVTILNRFANLSK